MINKKSYIGLIVVVVIFSLIFIPRIFERLKKDKVVTNIRTVNLSEKPLSFVEINKEKRKYKRQESLDGNFNWKDKLRTTAKIGLWLFTGGRIGKKMQETAANAGKI